METCMKVGDIIAAGNAEYRVVSVTQKELVLCDLSSPRKLGMVVISKPAEILDRLESGEYSLIEDEELPVADESILCERDRRFYELKVAVARSIRDEFGPDYKGLAQRGNPKVQEIIRAHGISVPYFWQIADAYLHSGLRESALYPKWTHIRKVGKTNKPGKKTPNSGCAFDAKAEAAVNVAVAFLRAGGAKTNFRAAYRYMNAQCYRETKAVDGTIGRFLVPQNQRLTYWQMTNAVKKIMSPAELERLKLGRDVQRNDKRMIRGEDTALYPGHIVEIDAQEVDVSVIDIKDPCKVDGRPVLYAMRDVRTHAVVAISVGFDNNSLIGLTGLFLNLQDDKAALCARYGIDCPDAERLWPSGFVPSCVRADHGSDFISYGFEDICKELGISHKSAPPRTGALKGLIEQWFHQAGAMYKPLLKDDGLITKDPLSKHHKKAVLTLRDFTRIMIECVLAYNGKALTCRMPKEIIEAGIDRTPASLWEYWGKKIRFPQPITDRAQYLYSLLSPYETTVYPTRRKGIAVNHVRYRDDTLVPAILEAERTGKRLALTVRYDPRDCSQVYRREGNRLVAMPIDTNFAWERSVAGLTFREVEALCRADKEAAAAGMALNDDRDAAVTGAIVETITEARARKKASGAPRENRVKNIRENRTEAKARHQREDSVAGRLNPSADRPAETTEGTTLPPPVTHPSDGKKGVSIDDPDVIDMINGNI